MISALTAFALVSLACRQAPADLQVTNIEAGTLVRYPVVLLRGTAMGSDLVAGLDWKHMIRFPVDGNRFVALVELKPGKNMVVLSSDNNVLKMRLDYRPMNTPYKVVSVYAASQDEPTDFDAPPGMRANQYGEKLDTVMKLLQCFTAEAMNDAGYGRKTFPLELDESGRVVVHVVRVQKPGSELRAMGGQDLWHMLYDFLSPQFTMDEKKCCTVMSFTRYSRPTRTVTGHTALGGGGLSVFGGASMYLWPTTLRDVPKVFADSSPIDQSVSFDDSAGRGAVWASASTTLGAMLHEMGHTFGLPHSVDPFSIMSRGFDHLNRMFTVVEPSSSVKGEPYDFTPQEVAHWDPFFAARLNWNPWFQPDGRDGGRFMTPLEPTIERDPQSGEVVIKGQYGLRVVGAEHDGKPSTFQTFPDSPQQVVRLREADLRAKVGSDTITVYALDDQGNEARLELRP